MMLKNNNINSVLNNLSYNKIFNNNFKKFNKLTQFKLILNNINIKLKPSYFYKLFLHGILKKLFKTKKLKSKLKYKRKLQKTILHINRTSLTLKSNRVYRYKIITGIGLKNNWIGIGEGKNKLFKNSYTQAMNASKKSIYNLNFNCNDYKNFKYKGCKFKILNMEANRNNIKIYDNIFNLHGGKKKKLISYSSKTPINVLRSLLSF